MRNMLLIAKREYLEQIRARAFLMSTIGLPAVFAIVLGIVYMASLGLGAKKHLVITASDAGLAAEIRSQLTADKDSKVNVDVVASPDASAKSSLLRELQSKSIDGILSLEAQPEGVTDRDLYVPFIGRLHDRRKAQKGIKRWPGGRSAERRRHETGRSGFGIERYLDPDLSIEKEWLGS